TGVRQARIRGGPRRRTIDAPEDASIDNGRIDRRRIVSVDCKTLNTDATPIRRDPQRYPTPVVHGLEDGVVIDIRCVELGKIAALQVLSHQTVSGYRETTKPLPEIARELKVDALLEGTVLHSGRRVR